MIEKILEKVTGFLMPIAIFTVVVFVVIKSASFFDVNSLDLNLSLDSFYYLIILPYCALEIALLVIKYHKP